MEKDEEPMISVAELAEKLGCSADYVRAQVRTGKWPHHNFGPRMKRFSAANVEEITNASNRAPASLPLREEIAELQKQIASMKVVGFSESSIKRKQSRLRQLGVTLLLEQEALMEP